MLIVNEQIRIPHAEFQWAYVRASGPGGQNVNKVASKVVLRWNVLRSPSLPDDVKNRLVSEHGNRLTTQGDILIASQRFRDQEKNRKDALERLCNLIQSVATPPKLRKSTRRTRGSMERRLSEKRRRSQAKSARRVSHDD